VAAPPDPNLDQSTSTAQARIKRASINFPRTEFCAFIASQYHPPGGLRAEIGNIDCLGKYSRAPTKTAVSLYQIETSHAETEYDINRPLSAHPANPQCIDHQGRQGHIYALFSCLY
jgi:hypothetical protein